MHYTKKSFSVNAPGSKSYADNWERTFRRPLTGERECAAVDLRGASCGLNAVADFGDVDTPRWFCEDHGEAYLKATRTSALAQEPDAK